MTICVDVFNIRSKGAVIIAPTIINYLLSLYPTSQLILLTHPASQIDLSKIDPIKYSLINKYKNSSFEINRSSDISDFPRYAVNLYSSHSSPNQSQSIDNLQLDNDRTHSNIPHSSGISVSIKTLSGNRYFRFLWMFFLSRKYLKQNECDHLISLGGYYLGGFRPFSIVIQNLLPFSPEALSLYRYSFPLTYIKFLLLRHFTLSSASKSEKVYYFTDKSKKVLNRYGINHHRFHQFENSAIWNPAEPSPSPINPSPDNYYYLYDIIESGSIQSKFDASSVNLSSKTPHSKNEAGENGSNHINNTFEKGTLEKISHSGSNVPDDISKQNSILAPIPQRPDYLNLLYVAELLLYKNHLILFAAVHDLLIEGYKISLTLVGDLHNSYSRKIIDFRNSLRFANEITFLGSCPHEELLKIYPLYDCLVYPSLVESLGIPIYEAIAFGLPVICSGFIDFIPGTDTSSISLFNPLDKDELKNCIKYLYSQKFLKSYTETSSSEISPVESFPIELTEKV